MPRPAHHPTRYEPPPPRVVLFDGPAKHSTVMKLPAKTMRAFCLRLVKLDDGRLGQRTISELAVRCFLAADGTDKRTGNGGARKVPASTPAGAWGNSSRHVAAR